MSIFRINGATPLYGRISVHGSKNSVLPILAATLIHPGESVIHNCPDLSDVRTAVSILEYLGCCVTREGSTITVNARDMNCFDIPDQLMREMRSSVIFLGAVLARCGHAIMSFPGGCELGPRPIDLHLSALRELGADIEEHGGQIFCESSALLGRDINLSFPSVGATENIMLAAVHCVGKTRILNAAREPEIEDLQEFLCGMGARISGAGSGVIEIEGVRNTQDVEHTVIPDRIVAATYLTAAAIAGGDVLVEHMIPAHIATVTSLLSDCGALLDIGENYIRIIRRGALYPMRAVRTMPYPGFPTDAQAPIMALATQCDGTTLFIENIFDSRYRHVSELARMGADIKVEGRVALVYGGKPLSGAMVHSSDLRGGAALVVAALAAEGESIVSGLSHIDRGYEHLECSLSEIGAQIIREPS